MKLRALWALPFVVVAIACNPGGATSGIAKAPDYEPKGQTKCSAKASQSEPLIVEWPSAARGQLESIVENRKTVAVVRYEGCEMKVLSTCTAPGKLTYVPFRNQKQDSVHIKSADDLYASLPVGAAGLEAKLERVGELTVDITLVGRYESDASRIGQSDLKGDCAGATHVVRAVSVGAFDFHTGAAATAAAAAKLGPAAAGGGSSTSQETLAKDGLTAACEKAGGNDTEPPMNCGALVRIEVVAIGPVAAPPTTASPTPTPTPTPTPIAPAATQPTAPAAAPPSASEASFRYLVPRLKGFIDTGVLSVVVRNGHTMIVISVDYLFAPGRPDLKAAGEEILTKIAAVLAGDETMKAQTYQVVGHTDNVGMASANMTLSEGRATLVKGVFTRTLPAASWSSRGAGASNPIADSDTSEGRAKNRRIEIVVAP